MVRQQRNIFNTLRSANKISSNTNPNTNGNTNGNNNGSTNLKNTINSSQLAALEQIYESYTRLIADKSFESIPSNYTQYMELLTKLKSIQITDSNLELLIQITENSLTGSMNVGALYTSYAYNEIKVALLNKRIRDILSDKNTQQAATNVSGQFTATQTFTMAPIFSYYVFLYGLPEYGVGFDPAKMAFLQSLPQFMVQGKPDHENIQSDVLVAPPNHGVLVKGQ
jgi:hypothetical protein